MVVCLNLSEGQWALEARLIGRSTTTTLKTILYIESTLKSAYSTGHSDWLFSFKKINVDAPKEKLKSAEHHNGTTVWRRESLSDQAGSLTWPRGAFCAPHAVNMSFVVSWALVAVFSYQCSDLKLHWEPVQVTNSVVKMDLEPSCGEELVHWPFIIITQID